MALHLVQGRQAVLRARAPPVPRQRPSGHRRTGGHPRKRGVRPPGRPGASRKGYPRAARAARTLPCKARHPICRRVWEQDAPHHHQHAQAAGEGPRHAHHRPPDRRAALRRSRRDLHRARVPERLLRPAAGQISHAQVHRQSAVRHDQQHLVGARRQRPLPERLRVRVRPAHREHRAHHQVPVRVQLPRDSGRAHG